MASDASLHGGPPTPASDSTLGGMMRPAQVWPWQAAPVGGAATKPPIEVIALNRLAFGPTPSELTRMRAMGLSAYIEEQLNPERIDDSACEARLAALALPYLDADVPTLWALSYSEGERAFASVRTATWVRAIYSRRQLQEVLVDHWHNHFNIYGRAYPIFSVWPDYDRRIRRNIFGNFRAFLEDIATSTAMLYYLNNVTNSRAGPNENYARELFELHSLGVAAYKPGVQTRDPTWSGYQDWDVYEAARCFTGWSVNNEKSTGNTGEFLYKSAWHDYYQKQVLNTQIMPNQRPLQDGRDVLDLVARHPATARFVATRLARRLVSDEPSESLITAAATAFADHRDAPDQLRKVTRVILTHPDFTSVWGEKFKRPFEMVAYALRATNASWTWTSTFNWNMSLVGQRLFEWSPPTGYPDTRGAWLTSTYLLRRWNFLNSLCEGGVSGTTVNLVAETPAASVTARQIVRYWADRVLGYRLSESELAPFYDFMARGRNLDLALPTAERNGRINSLVALILSSPYAQWR